MTPEQATFLRDFLLEQIDGEFNTTKRVLAAIPDDQSDYQPDPKSRTARQLAWHIVECELSFFKGIAEGAFSIDGESSDPTKSMRQMITHYETEFKDGIAKMRALNGKHLAAPIPFFGVFNHPAVIYLTFLASHSIHHRGQLSAYLRAMGSKVPAIYGPSGDEMWNSNEGTAMKD